MKSKRWAQLARTYLKPVLENAGQVRVTDSLFVLEPVEWMVRGIHGSFAMRRKDTVSVVVFVQPLWVPLDHVIAEHSFRLQKDGVNGWWKFDDDPERTDFLMREITDAVITQAVPWLRSMATVEAFLDASERRYGPNLGGNASLVEEHAYGLILVGSRERAAKKLEQVIKATARNEPPLAWVEELRTRARTVLVHLERAEDPTPLLAQWRDQTAQALGLMSP